MRVRDAARLAGQAITTTVMGGALLGGQSADHASAAACFAIGRGTYELVKRVSKVCLPQQPPGWLKTARDLSCWGIGMVAGGLFLQRAQEFREEAINSEDAALGTAVVGAASAAVGVAAYKVAKIFCRRR